MEVNGDMKSIQIRLYISPVFFRTVSKIVQALVKTYHEIFQLLMLEGDVLLPKPFIDPTPSTVQPRLGPLSFSRVGQTAKTSPMPVISI
jgi:hypothetical protein